MPIVVQCPSCQKELAAPDELVGRTVECPSCKGRFTAAPASGTSRAQPAAASAGSAAVGTTSQRTKRPVGSGSVSMGSPVAMPPTAMPPTAMPPVAMPPVAQPPTAQPPIARSGSQPPVAMPPVAMPPVAMPSNGTAPSASPPKSAPPIAGPPLAGPPFAGGSPAAPPIASPPIAGQSGSAAYPSAPPVGSASGTGKFKIPTVDSFGPVARHRSNRAEFLSADTTKTQVHLGADGQLPELRLEEVSVQEKKSEEAPKTNPLVLIGALGFSVVMSVLMLFVDSEPAAGENQTKADARELIITRYLPGDPPAPYQALLREAVLAESQGRYLVERQRYRQVLDMLHSDGKNDFEGLTGAISSQTGPSDQELEKLLEKLLAED